MKTTFIYALCEPGTRTVRYIGKANNPEKRLRAHLQKSMRFDTHLGRWLKLLKRGGRAPEMVVLREVEGDGSEAEMRYIRLARGCRMRLVNSTDGGEGCLNPSPETLAKKSSAMSGEKNHMFGKTGEAHPMFGSVRSPETRARMSGKNHPMFGRTGSASPNFGKPSNFSGGKHTEGARAKISAASSGEKNPFFGKEHTEASKALQRAAKLGKPATEAQLASLSLGRGPKTPEVRAAISAGHKAGKARRKQRDQEIEWALAPYTLE